MNDMYNSADAPDAGAPAAPSPPAHAIVAAAPAQPPRSRSRRLIYFLLLVLAVLMVAQWWLFHRELSGLRGEVAHRLRGSDDATMETKALLKNLQETVQAMQAQVSVLQNKQAEAQSQQAALAQLYQDMSRKREDWTMTEIEQVLTIANQQLQLAGNVQGALIALQNADARLARGDAPQFLEVRRAIEHDIERLKALPSVDVTGMTLRLDSIIGQVDDLPLLSDERPPSPGAASKAAGPHARPIVPARPATAPWLATLQAAWQEWSAAVWGDVRQLVSIRKVDEPEALLVSPTQAYYLRENLKLRLLNARLGLLARNEPAFRNDLAAAQDAITRYFDTRARRTQNVLAILKQMQATNLAVEMPTLSESLNAIRAYKPRP